MLLDQRVEADRADRELERGARLDRERLTLEHVLAHDDQARHMCDQLDLVLAELDLQYSPVIGATVLDEFCQEALRSAPTKLITSDDLVLVVGARELVTAVAVAW